MEYCAYCGNAVPAVSDAPCPYCGKPSNGAAPPQPAAAAAAKGGSNVALIVVGVVVGGLVVVAIIGILAAIAIPNLLTAMQRSKQKRTMADIRTIAIAAESYASDNNEYPKSLDGLTPKYAKTLPKVDGWGKAIDYECVTEEQGRCTGYAIRSRGKDMISEELELRDALQAAGAGRATRNFDCDIIYTNGQFVEYPEGVQH